MNHIYACLCWWYIIIDSDIQFITSLINHMNSYFDIENIGSLCSFLIISITKSCFGCFLSQIQYATNLLKRAGMKTCHPCNTTSFVPHFPFSPNTTSFYNPKIYYCLVGCLQWLTFRRLDISNVVNLACQAMHASTIASFYLLINSFWDMSKGL